MFAPGCCSRSDKDRSHVQRIVHPTRDATSQGSNGSLRTPLTSRMTSTLLTRHLKSTFKMTPRQQRKTMAQVFFVFQTTVLPTMHFTSSRLQKLTPVLHFQASAAGLDKASSLIKVIPKPGFSYLLT